MNFSPRSGSHITEGEGKTQGRTLFANILEANCDFTETFDIELKEGRSFSKVYGYSSETSKAFILLHENFLK